MQTLLIGDIHGCYAELQDLLDKAGLGEDAQIIALGDVLDRGPESPQVFWFFQQTPHAQSLMGNHERKHVRGARREVKLATSQEITQWQMGKTAYQHTLAWMQTLPIYLELPEAILVHGYLEPNIPLSEQRPTVLTGTMSGDRYLTKTYDRPWYELYQGDKPVVVGHHDYQRNGQAFIYQDRVYGLDTSCVHGKTLTGLLLPNFKTITVPSRQNHWRYVKQAYREAIGWTPRPPKVRPKVMWAPADEAHLVAAIREAKEICTTLLVALQADPEYETLPPRQQAKKFAQHLGDHDLAPLVHLARRDELTLERAYRVFRGRIKG